MDTTAKTGIAASLPTLRGASVRLVSEMIQAYTKNQQEIKWFYEQCGISEKLLQDEKAFVPIESYCRFWQILIQREGKDQAGLKMARKGDIGMLGMLSHVMLVSPDLKTAMEAVARFHGCFTDAIRFDLVEYPEYYAFEAGSLASFKLLYPEEYRNAMEYCVSLLLMHFSQLARYELRPRRIEFDYARPLNAEAYWNLFHTHIRFGSERIRLVFDKKELEKPLPGYNLHLFRQFSQFLERDWTRRDETYSLQVKKILFQYLYDNRLATIMEVADLLRISARQLQRKLDAENTSFKEISEEVRKDVAISLLQDRKYSVREVAKLMGYNDTSAFRKAFKNWMGATPSDYFRFPALAVSA